MIYDAVEQAYAIAVANFATDFAALVSAKGLSGLTMTVSFVKRQKAETFVELGIVTLPACGVYGERASTQAKSQGSRDSTVAAVYDYYAVGPEPVLLAKQVELAAEALLQSIDRLWSADGGVFGAGEPLGSIQIELSEGFSKTQEPNYDRRAILRFPVNDRDTGL